MQKSILKKAAHLLHPLLQPKHLVFRALGPTALGLGALVLVGMPLSWWSARHTAIEQQGERAGALAASIALGINGEEHEAWLSQYEINDKAIDWETAPNPLGKLHAGILEVAHASSFEATISTLHLSAANRDLVLKEPKLAKPNLLERMVTTASGSRWRAKVDYMPEMEHAILQGTTVGSELLTGSTGRAVFGWAPIVDGFGAVNAIVQVEIPLDAKLAGIFHGRWLNAAWLLALLGGSLFLGGLRIKRTAQALCAIGQTAQSGVLEDPYLADDIAAETLFLADCLETRRELEVITRQELTTKTAHAEHSATRSRQDLGGHERFRQSLASDFPASLRRIARAVGSVSTKEIPSEEVELLRESVLKTCELARVLDQHRELGALTAGKIKQKKSMIDLRALINGSAFTSRERAAKRNVDLRVVIGDAVPYEVLGDGQMLLRCLSIFTENAVQTVARAGGGSVSMRVKRLEGTEETVVRFEFCDSAPGMSESEAKVLFDPFPTARGTHRRREHPLDASLSIASELLRLQGGEITLESVPGSGTRIAFSLPFRVKIAPVEKTVDIESPAISLAQAGVGIESGHS